MQTHYTIKHTHACRHAHTNTCTENNNYSDMNHSKEIIVIEAYCQLWKLVVERCQECPLPVIGPGWESWHADDVLLGLITNFCSVTQFFDGIAKTKSKFLFGLEVNVHKSKEGHALNFRTRLDIHLEWICFFRPTNDVDNSRTRRQIVNAAVKVWIVLCVCAS